MTTDKHNPWQLYTLPVDEPGLEPLKALLPDDDTRGIVIGENWEIRHLIDTLERYLQTGQTDGEIDSFDERLGHPWLTTDEALAFSSSIGMPVNSRTLRWACAHGFIRSAEKTGRDWRFPKNSLLAWLHHRPKPGRK